MGKPQIFAAHNILKVWCIQKLAHILIMGVILYTRSIYIISYMYVCHIEFHKDFFFLLLWFLNGDK